MAGIGRLLHTYEDMMVNKIIINSGILRDHFRRTGVYGEHEISLMLDPADLQDVPRAIDFIQAVLLPPSLQPGNSDDPSKIQEAQVILVIGEMFSVFMDPFIQPNMSLTAQVTSLNQFAHIAFVLFCQNRTNFMPHQLYGDIQTTIKNVIFCITKQQEIDGEQPFYLF